jgi:sarcosine oxidase gamma subunit
LCGLDFHPAAFPKGSAKQSSVAKTTQLVVCHDLAETAAYSIIGGRSLAAYLWETILVAGRDLGVRPVGIHVWPA